MSFLILDLVHYLPSTVNTHFSKVTEPQAKQMQLLQHKPEFKDTFLHTYKQ